MTPIKEVIFDNIKDAKWYAYEHFNENRIIVIYDKEKGETITWN